MSADPNADDLLDAAAVHAAREQLVQALGQLAARPLDENATALMRQAIERVESAGVRRALRRLDQGGTRPPLVVVPAARGHHRTADATNRSAWSSWSPRLAMAGGAA